LLKNIKKTEFIGRYCIDPKNFLQLFCEYFFTPKKLYRNIKNKYINSEHGKYFLEEKKRTIFCRKFCENFSSKTFEWDIINSLNRNVRIFAINMVVCERRFVSLSRENQGNFVAQFFGFFFSNNNPLSLNCSPRGKK